MDDICILSSLPVLTDGKHNEFNYIHVPTHILHVSKIHDTNLRSVFVVVK